VDDRVADIESDVVRILECDPEMLIEAVGAGENDTVNDGRVSDTDGEPEYVPDVLLTSLADAVLLAAAV
jgi:hypothetical protein